MFEKILERVLLSHFGKYLTGFDKNNLKLGVWSGNVVIENVKVKQEIIESLELPIELIHSTIGRLVMKVPWNKLSSSPVEVLIEDILIVIAPKDPKDWDFSDKRLVQKKFNVLLNYARVQIEKFLTKKKKKNDSEDQQGYFDKLTLKVIDNLQLQVKNIHIRWEAKYEPQSYAWGIKLNSLDAFTTSVEWAKTFIDRTDEKNRLTPMNKQVLLEKLIVYWNPIETIFFEEEQPDQMNLVKIEEVINISAEFKWSQNVRSLFAQPLFDVLFDLNWIDISLKHSQLQQLILMLESISLYTKLLWMERKGATQIKYNQEEFKSTFCTLFAKVQKSEQKTFEILEENEWSQLNEIIRQVDYETLFLWTQTVMKSIILEKQVLELQKQRSKKGWFGWGGTNNADGESVVQDAEIKDLEQFIETTLAEQTDEFESAIVRPLSSIKYKASILLKGGSFQVSKEYTTGQMEKEGIKLNCKEVKLALESRQNKDFDSFFTVKTVGVYIQQKMHNSPAQLLPLCFQQQQANKDLDFFRFSLLKTNSKEFKDGFNPDLTVTCNVEPITWVYNPGIIQFVREMKDVKQGSLEESLKSATWNRLEKIQDNTQSRVNFLLASALQLDLNFNLVQLKVVIPMPNSQTEAWSLNIDEIIIKSHQKRVEDIYEYFDVVIQQSSFVYETKCQELIGGYQPQNGLKAIDQGNLSVFKNYTVQVQLAKLKDSVRQIVQEEGHALIKLSGRLNPLKLSLNEKSYRDLIYIPEAIMPPQSESQRLESLQQEKKSIVKQQIKSGWMKRRGQHIRVWNKCFMILSGGYLYFYDNETALMQNTSVYIKNGQIKRMDKDEENQEEFAFTLENRYDSCILACEDETVLREWTEVLNKKIKEYATEEEYIRIKEGEFNIQQEQDVAIIKRNTTQKNQLDVSLQIDATELVVFKGTQLQDTLLYLKAEGVEYNYQKSELSLNTQARMRSFILRDWTYQFYNEQYQDLIGMSSKHKYCLDVNIIQLKPQHEQYDKVDLLVKCNVEEINVNWKPDSFLKLRELMLIVLERKSRKWYYSQVKDYEVEAIKKGGSKLLAEDLRVRKLTDAMNDSLLKCEFYSQAKARTKDHFSYFLDFESFTKNYDWIYTQLVAPFYKQQVHYY